MNLLPRKVRDILSRQAQDAFSGERTGFFGNGRLESAVRSTPVGRKDNPGRLVGQRESAVARLLVCGRYIGFLRPFRPIAGAGKTGLSGRNVFFSGPKVAFPDRIAYIWET
ncbi:hypothetical protein [uncultured Bacteroides sp.]|uniref:hypothetical protein n=1 Tax=uncultured Bacteroides sp. TaxID=162156 RepID=UPI0025E271CC|nr:hypothetical protein [uncultured Bacteroides sp.]